MNIFISFLFQLFLIGVNKIYKFQLAFYITLIYSVIHEYNDRLNHENYKP